MKTTRIHINPAPSKDGWKSEEVWLAEALGATWTRLRGYTVASPARAALFERLRKAGVTASRRYLDRDRSPYLFALPSEARPCHTLSEVSKLVP